MTYEFPELRSEYLLPGVPGYSLPVPRTDKTEVSSRPRSATSWTGTSKPRASTTPEGTSSSTYYRRVKERVHPNAEELRLVATRSGLSYPDLQVHFRLMSREELRQYIDSADIYADDN